MFQPNQRVTVDLSGLVIQGVSFSQNVQKALGTILQQTASQLPEGVSFEQYLAAGGRTLEQVVEELRPDAESAVRRELVVEAVADAEGTEVSDEEIEEQVRADAEATGRAPDRLLHDLRDHGGWETLRQDLRMKKAVEVLTSGATPIHDTSPNVP